MTLGEQVYCPKLRKRVYPFSIVSYQCLPIIVPFCNFGRPQIQKLTAEISSLKRFYANTHGTKTRACRHGRDVVCHARCVAPSSKLGVPGDHAELQPKPVDLLLVWCNQHVSCVFSILNCVYKVQCNNATTYVAAGCLCRKWPPRG